MRALVEFTERFGNMVSRIFLMLVYFAVLGPFALVYQLFADPLHIKRQRNGNWVGWVRHNEDLIAARKQD